MGKGYNLLQPLMYNLCYIPLMRRVQKKNSKEKNGGRERGEGGEKEGSM